MLNWDVYYYNSNMQEIQKYNVLGGKYYSEQIKRIKKKSKTKEEFSESLRHEMMYHFWSRSEWELIIKLTKDSRVFLVPWCGCKDPENKTLEVTNDTSFDWVGFALENITRQTRRDDTKIDVYSQLKYRWEDFVAYCYNNK